MYTRPFWEKKVQALMGKLFGIEAWCPLKKTMRKWSDRIKLIEEPYFRSYVFVRATEKERITALGTDGVLECIRFHGQPARISEQEINSIKEFIELHSDVEVKQLEPGDRIIFCRGVFVDQCGIVQRLDGNKVILALSQLDCMMVATLADIKKVV
jgi:transcription antitermination factor NusG